MENHKKNFDNVETQTSTQEVHTTIGQIMSLRKEAHIQQSMYHIMHKHNITIY